MFIDPDLAQCDEVWAAAGRWPDALGIEPHELVEANGGMVADPTRGRTRPGDHGGRLWKNGQMPVRALVEAFYDQLWNRVDLSIASVILHPDVSFRGSVGVGAVGRAGVCDYVTMVTTALADYRCDVEGLIVEGPSAAAKVLFSGLHRGDFLGYPPTGRRVEWMGAAFFVAQDDMLRDIWVLGDLASLRAQLGG